MKTQKSGFTLIELLIVVAIIAILAAIAVPNFLEAQTRSKVTRAKADMRTITTAFEAYYVDWNRYPPDCYASGTANPEYNPPDCNAPWYTNSSISTPIAYMTSANLVDPFNTQPQPAGLNNFRYVNFEYTYIYMNGGTGAFGTAFDAYSDIFGVWKITSDGPDQEFSRGDTSGLLNSEGTPLFYNQNVRYDPSNGTISNGDIIRSQKYSDNPSY